MSSPWSWQPGPPTFLASSGLPSLPSDVAARTYNRALWGGELAFAIGTLVNPGFSDMLLTCRVHLPEPSTGVAKALTFDHVREATRRLRFHHPGIAATIAFPPFTTLAAFDPSRGRLVYQSPSSPAEVSAWIDQVVQDRSPLLAQHSGDLEATLLALKAELGSITCPRDQWMFKLHFLADPSTGKYGVLIHTGHTIFDGIGTFEVMDLWLHELAGVLAGSDASTAGGVEGEVGEELKWGEEVGRLAQAVPDRLDEPWQPGPPTSPEHPVLKAMAESLTLTPVRPLLSPTHPA
jgi:hypothetical protein